MTQRTEKAVAEQESPDRPATGERLESAPLRALAERPSAAERLRQVAGMVVDGEQENELQEKLRRHFLLWSLRDVVEEYGRPNEAYGGEGWLSLHYYFSDDRGAGRELVFRLSNGVVFSVTRHKRYE